MVIQGTVARYRSSTKTELVGLLAAILASPRNTPTTIYIDNLAVVTQFGTLVEDRQNCTERQRLRSSYVAWWAAVHHAYIQQGENIRVQWIKGHSNSAGNNAADRAAQLGHNAGLWALNEKEHNDMLCHARFNGADMEDDLRRVLKRQSAVRTNARWASQNRTVENIKDWKTVDWKATLHIIHNGNSPRGLFTSPADCSKRAHRTKKLHGMLPTLAYMAHCNQTFMITIFVESANRTLRIHTISGIARKRLRSNVRVGKS